MMEPIVFFEDIHALAHIWARYHAYGETQPFRDFLKLEEPRRWEHLYALYEALVKTYAAANRGHS